MFLDAILTNHCEVSLCRGGSSEFDRLCQCRRSACSCERPQQSKAKSKHPRSAPHTAFDFAQFHDILPVFAQLTALHVQTCSVASSQIRSCSLFRDDNTDRL